MNDYQVFKVKANGHLEPMGVYQANGSQGAINKMAERGNISGNEWTMKYIAIRTGLHFQHKRITT